jgi:hypothetical protein
VDQTPAACQSHTADKRMGSRLRNQEHSSASSRRGVVRRTGTLRRSHVQRSGTRGPLADESALVVLSPLVTTHLPLSPDAWQVKKQALIIGWPCYLVTRHYPPATILGSPACPREKGR